MLTNGGWDTDYLPILQKDRLVASAAIKDGKLAFSNLYMGHYYLVERATGLVLPIDGNGKLYTTGKYPQLNKSWSAPANTVIWFGRITNTPTTSIRISTLP